MPSDQVIISPLVEWLKQQGRRLESFAVLPEAEDSKGRKYHSIQAQVETLGGPFVFMVYDNHDVEPPDNWPGAD